MDLWSNLSEKFEGSYIIISRLYNYEIETGIENNPKNLLLINCKYKQKKIWVKPLTCQIVNCYLYSTYVNKLIYVCYLWTKPLATTIHNASEGLVSSMTKNVTLKPRARTGCSIKNFAANPPTDKCLTQRLCINMFNL